MYKTLTQERMAGYMPSSIKHTVNVDKFTFSPHSSQSSPINSSNMAYVINHGITFLELPRSTQIELLQWCGHSVSNLNYGSVNDALELVNYIITRPATHTRGPPNVILTENEAIWIIDERIMKNVPCSNSDFQNLTKLATRLPQNVRNSGIVYNNIPIRSPAALF